MRAKIVATIGPATGEPEKLKKVFEKGTDVARLNFSHGSHEEFGQWIKEIRRYSEELDRPIGIIQDLQGPKIRLGSIPSGRKALDDNHEVVLVEGKAGRDELEVRFPKFIESIKKGSRVLLNDGLIELIVKGKSKKKAKCVVVNGGEVVSFAGVNLPGVDLKTSSFTEKDKKDLFFGIKNKVDFVALSFVKSSHDIRGLRDQIESYSLQEKVIPPKIIAKIEKKEAVDNLKSIIRASDAVMVARGDLGIEMPEEEVPLLQKRIIDEAKEAGKPVITATQMLDSMTRNPRPTRAEVSDVANAIVDGTDAVMLSNETSVGVYPLEAVEEMRKIIEETEHGLHEHRNIHKFSFHKPNGGAQTATITDAAAASSCEMASHLGAKYIVTTTSSGYSARMVAKHRSDTRILALTPDKKVYNQLSVLWGVEPLMLPSFHTTDELIYQSADLLEKKKLTKTGDFLIIIAGHPVGMKGQTNLIKVHKV